MRTIRLLVAWFFVSSVATADLSKIDRSIGKEPAYLTKPKYCLLVFGEPATTKIWVVDDGRRIFVDRNANGDLTEAGELIEPAPPRNLGGLSEIVFTVPNLKPADGSGEHTNFKLTRFKEGNGPDKYAISVKVNGRIQQFAGWDAIFAEARLQAPIIHFGGPLIARAIRFHEISLSSKKPELHLCFGTPGVGNGSFGFLGYEAVPKRIEPVAIIRWPGKGSDLITTVPMLSRC